MITKISEMEKVTDRTTGRLDITEEIIIKLDDTARETRQNEKQEKKHKKSKNKTRIRESLRYGITSVVQYVNLKSTEENTMRLRQKIFEKIMTESFSNLMKTGNPYAQDDR